MGPDSKETFPYDGRSLLRQDCTVYGVSHFWKLIRIKLVDIVDKISYNSGCQLVHMIFTSDTLSNSMSLLVA